MPTTTFALSSSEFGISSILTNSIMIISFGIFVYGFQIIVQKISEKTKSAAAKY